MTIFFFASICANSQNILTTEQDIIKAEESLKSKKEDEAKVDLILALSNHHFEKNKYFTKPITKSETLAKEAYRISKKLNYKKGLGASYLLLSMLEQHDNHFKKSKTYASIAVAILSKIDEPNLLGEAWVMIWSSNILMGMNYEDRIVFLEKARQCFQKANNKKRLADCYKEMGDIYFLIGNGKESLACLKKALPLYKESHYENLEGIYDLMGAVYIFLGDYKEGLKYAFLALDTAEKTGSERIFLCTIYNRIGLAYEEMGDMDNALKYLEKSLKVATDFNDTNNIRILVGNYCGTLIKIKNYNEALALIVNTKKQHPKIESRNASEIDCILITIYVHKNQLDKALDYQKKVISKLEYIKDYHSLLITYSTLINLNLVVKDYKKAIYYTDLYHDMCKKLDKDIYFADYNLWEFKIDSAKGNLAPAMEHYKEYVRISKKCFDEKKSNEINRLNILYETEKKDKYITNLKDESIIQNNSLEKASLMRNIMYAGFILLFAFIFFLYKAYILKQKNNLILKTQQEEINQNNLSLKQAINEKEWLLKEIHHRVKNNLHMVVGLLASQTEYLKGKEAIDANLESQRRVESMSMIHDKLYQSENLSLIDMPSYILDLTYYLSDSFDKGKQIRFSIDVDKVDFPLSHSVPIGLILNEAITNAIKYAFPENIESIIKIILKEKNSEFKLIIWDNGIGIPDTIDIENSKTLGLKLIKGLSEDIQADFKISNESGTKIELTFTI